VNSSPSIARLAPALVAAQDDLRGVEKSATNPHFKSKYAPLDAIIGMVRPALAKHGLAVVQSAGPSADGKGLDVITRIVHTSGEWLEGNVYIPLAKFDPQGAGAGVTYGRRFGLSALLAISTDEDDDGNNASRPPAKRQDRPAKPAASLESTAQASPLTAPYKGRPEDRRVKNVRLGDMAPERLRELKAWAIAKDDENYGPLVKDIIDVLSQKALGQDDDSRVARMKAEAETESPRLPFD
jgi:hypothetical protein